MTKKVYNKLVRSDIPTIIKESGRECFFTKLNLEDNREEIISLLKEKLIEESKEVVEAVHKGDMLEEIGDLEAVLGDLKALLTTNHHEISTLSDAKMIKNGRLSNVIKDPSGAFTILSTSSANSRNPEYNREYIKLISVVSDGQETKD
jgi:predicted house-cleaning noncanonical NTP pyrophosphatase (MazG superfamily)